MPANKATRKYDLPRFKFGFPQLPSRRPGKTKVKAATTPGRIISERGYGPRPSRETLALELSFKFSIRATTAIALETPSCLGDSCPILVSGGRIADWHTSVAQLMKSVLEGYFGVPVTWSEQESRTTYENALYTAQLLRGEPINTVVVIAQREDLPRAIWSFKRVGIRAIPWPTPRTPLKLDRAEDFVPDSRAFYESFHALHEMI